MIKHIWSILCKKSLIDAESKNLTLSDVIEQVNISLNVPLSNTGSINIPFEAEIVSLWMKEGKGKSVHGETKVEFFDPQGVLVNDAVQKIEIALDVRRLRTRLRFNAFSIKNSGNYLFKIKLKEEGGKDYNVVSEIPLEINISNKSSVH